MADLLFAMIGAGSLVAFALAWLTRRLQPPHVIYIPVELEPRKEGGCLTALFAVAALVFVLYLLARW